MYESIAPVWEANHMWLIIAIVVLFVGFPRIYALMSTYLHIPLVLMLIGIIAQWYSIYLQALRCRRRQMADSVHSNLLLCQSAHPFFLGLIAAATVSSSINPDATGFLDLYIFSWLNWFGVSVGLLL